MSPDPNETTTQAQFPPPPLDLGPPAPPPPQEPMPPWEFPERWGGWWSALLETLRRVLFEPSQTFHNMSPVGNLGRAFGYAMLLNGVTLLVNWPFLLLVQSFQNFLMKNFATGMPMQFPSSTKTFILMTYPITG